MGPITLYKPSVDARTQTALHRWMTLKLPVVDSRTPQDDGFGVFRGLGSAFAFYAILGCLWVTVKVLWHAFGVDLIYAAGWIVFGCAFAYALRRRLRRAL